MSIKRFPTYSRPEKSEAMAPEVEAIFLAISDAEGLDKMRDSDPHVAQICARLHYIINILGFPPDCEEAVRLRSRRKDIFGYISKDGLDDELVIRLAFVRRLEGRPVEFYARAWGCTEKSALDALEELKRLRWVRAVVFPRDRTKTTLYYPGRN